MTRASAAFIGLILAIVYLLIEQWCLRRDIHDLQRRLLSREGRGTPAETITVEYTFEYSYEAEGFVQIPTPPRKMPYGGRFAKRGRN